MIASSDRFGAHGAPYAKNLTVGCAMRTSDPAQNPGARGAPNPSSEA